MRIQELDRIVLVTDEFDAAYDRLPEMFDMQFGDPYTTEVMGHTMKVSQGPGLEIYTSLDDEGPVADYLEKNGPGLYCVVWRVDDIEATKEHLASFDVTPVHEFEEPAHEVFYHPSDFFGMFTVFIEYPHPLQRA